MNKLLAGVSILFFSTSLVKCTYTYEEIKPLDEDMGEWDGNYIYKGNIRCKTTGEDESILIEELVVEDKVYTIDYINDYFYKDDHIYMLLESKEYTEDLSTLITKHSFLVDYSIANQNYEVVYSMSDETAVLHSFYEFDDFAFIRIDKSFGSLIKFDFKNNQIDHMNEALYDLYDYDFVGNNVLIIYKDQMIKYTYCDEINLVDIRATELADTHNLFYSWIDDKYLCIKSNEGVYNSAVDSYVYYSSLEVYDFSKNKLSSIFSSKDCMEIEYITPYYFIKGKTTAYEYVSSIKNLQSNRYERLTANLLTHNSLCKIDYENATYSPVYEFEDKDVDYSNGYIEDNKYYISSTYIVEGSQFKTGGYKHKEYILDLNKLKLRRKNFENKKQNTVPERNSSIVYGDYEYYLTSRNYGSWLGGHTAFYLNRKNLVTGEEKVMQFFTNEFEYNYDSEERIMVGTRFSKLLWEDEYYQFSDDIIYITNM